MEVLLQNGYNVGLLTGPKSRQVICSYAILIAMVHSERSAKNILLIADDAPEMKVIASTLRKAGFHVLNVPCAAAAVRRLVERGEPIDLAIVDAPGAQDHDLLHGLHNYYPDLRLLFLYSSEPAGSEMGPAGHVRGYLHKPVRRAQLLGTVLKLFETPSIYAA